MLTACSNDGSYDSALVQTLESRHTSDHDTLLVLSGSGNSTNVIRLTCLARGVGITTLALTGMSGGTLTQTADASIIVASDSMQIIEDVHLAIGHMLCLEVIRLLKG